jgi:hypothetical protein
MIEEGDGQDADRKAGGYPGTVGGADDSNDKGDKEEKRQQVQEMKEGANIEEPDQLAAPDILPQVGLDGKDGQFLHEEAHKDIYQEIIQDEAAEGVDDILPGKQLWQKIPEGHSQEEGAAQQVDDNKSDEDLGGQVFAGAPTSPEGFPLM